MPCWLHCDCPVVGLCVQGASAAVFNVGDSRAYRVDDSEDPHWKPGSLFARSSMLTQSFGGGAGFSEIRPHLHVEPCVAGSTYLLCSDGVYEALDEEQLRELIGSDLPGSVEAILRAALKYFASDNVTVALVRIVEQA